MTVTPSDEWAVVVGATGAIGRRIVERMTDRGLGVVAIGRTAETLATLSPDKGSIVTCRCDISKDESVDLIRNAIPGPVRIAVNAAAAPLGGPVLEVTPEAIQAAIAVKVNGTLTMVRAVDGFLVEDSRIVMFGGNLGHDPIPEASTAGIGNAAVANLVRQLSRALGPRQVTCHVVAPGPVWTERLHSLIADAARARAVDESAVIEEFRARSPIGHLVTIDEVVWAVDLLLDPEARSLAGGTLLLDAGQRTAIP